MNAAVGSLRRSLPFLLFGGAVFALLAWASRTFPVVWDETIYFDASDAIRRWAARGFPMDGEALRRIWNYSPYHNPHPPFFRILSAFCSAWGGGLLPFPLSYRLPHLLFIAFAATTLFAALARRFPVDAAASAVGWALLQPRVFGELLVGTTDGPVLMAWVVLPVLLWCREKENDPLARRLLAAAFIVVLAAASAAKVTAFLALLPLGAVCAIRKRKADLPLISGAAVAALCLVALSSPAGWGDPVRTVWDYLTYPFSRKGIPIDTYYGGRVYDGLHMPWHYFLGMTAATTPLLVLTSSPGAIAARGAEKDLSQSLLWPLLFWMVLVHLPSVPRHDGVRQFAAVYPLLGLLASLGWETAAARLGRPRAVRPFRVFPLVLLALSLLKIHPFEMSYYSGAVGGLRGAERKGFETSYALEPVGAFAVEWLNAHASLGARVFLAPDWPDLLARYHRQGALRADLQPMSDGAAWDYAVVCRRRSLIDDRRYFAGAPAAEFFKDGVSLARVFSRPPADAAPSGGSH